jgi:Zinc finger, C2H2 type
MCKDCSAKLQVACEIKQKCIETDKLLRTKLKNEHSEHQDKMHEITELVNLKHESNDDNRELSDVDENKFDNMSCDIEIPVKFLYNENSKTVTKRKLPDDSNSIQKKKSLDLECFICRRTFDKVYEKRQHVLKIHSTVLVCHVCNKKQKSPITVDKCLGDHIYGFRGFICSSCGKKFRRAHQLATHYNLDHEDMSKQEIYYCDICGHRFRYKGTLSKHIRLLHLHAKQFGCPHSDTCPNLSYATKDSLKLHLYRKHDLKAPYSCSLCNLGFNYECELEMHCKKRTCKKGFCKGTTIKKYCEQIDVGYACKFPNCTRVFPEKQLWSFHFNAYHRDNKTCKICNKEFSCEFNFN